MEYWWFVHWPECPPSPPKLGHLCVPPAGAQACHYDDANGGSEQSPFVSKCCCGRCDTDTITCAPDSITGFGVWLTIYSPLCPAEGCGSEGEWWRPNCQQSNSKHLLIVLSQVLLPRQTTLVSILTTLTKPTQLKLRVGRYWEFNLSTLLFWASRPHARITTM